MGKQPDMTMARRVREEMAAMGSGAGAPDDEVLRVWQVTAVDTDTGTCTIKMLAVADGTMLDIGELAGVFYPTASVPSVGAQGLLCRLANGTAVFFAGGGAEALYARAKAHMTTDDSPHTAETYNADGTAADEVTVRRPYDRFVTEGTFGCVVVDAGGQNLFIPMGGFVEARTETMGDPTSPAVGQQWMILPDDQLEP